MGCSGQAPSRPPWAWRRPIHYIVFRDDTRQIEMSLIQNWSLIFPLRVYFCSMTFQRRFCDVSYVVAFNALTSRLARFYFSSREYRLGRCHKGARRGPTPPPPPPRTRPLRDAWLSTYLHQSKRLSFHFASITGLK